MCQSWVPRDPGHGTRNVREDSGSFKLIHRCVKAGAMRSWSWHQKCERGPCLLIVFLLNSPVLEICNVLCTSCCVVFYDVSPLTGQVLGKVLLTSRENELTIDGDFRTKQFIEVPKLLTHLAQSQGYLVLWLGLQVLWVNTVTSLLVDQLFGHCLSESSLSPGPVLSSNTSIEFKSYRSNIYLILAQYPLTLTNQDLHMPESQPHVAPQHRPS